VISSHRKGFRLTDGQDFGYLRRERSRRRCSPTLYHTTQPKLDLGSLSKTVAYSGAPTSPIHP